ncbi:hypothetical protein [Nocardia asteroides]|uniref:hypothetical protein n=1 Tax=Nocardia asteroides TaxID=1824 RepID=UPI001E308972|nr:hypothetical protein [Nocardia asteroides]UGT63109.1 hypothetical protein LTT61_07220 [Nocardia asteroides]
MPGRTENRPLLARLALAGVCAAIPLVALAAPAVAAPDRRVEVGAPFDCHVWDGPTLPGERCYPHERRDRPQEQPRYEPNRPTPSDYFGPGWFGSS